MAETRAFITADDLIDAMSETTFMALFNDANVEDVDDVKTSTPVKSVIFRAHAQVISFLPRVYTALPPESPAGVTSGSDSIPILLKDAELKWAMIYAYRRHKEYVKTYSAQPGGPSEKEALEAMERIADLVQQIASSDNPPTAKPGLPQSIVVDDSTRIIMSDPDGTSNQGDF